VCKIEAIFAAVWLQNVVQRRGHSKCVVSSFVPRVRARWRTSLVLTKRNAASENVIVQLCAWHEPHQNLNQITVSLHRNRRFFTQVIESSSSNRKWLYFIFCDAAVHERFVWEEGNNVTGNTTMGGNALTHCARQKKIKGVITGGDIASTIFCDVVEVDHLVWGRRNIILPSRMESVS